MTVYWRIRFKVSNAEDTAHRLRATTSATKINASSILTTTDRVWHGPLITVYVLCILWIVLPFN